MKNIKRTSVVAMALSALIMLTLVFSGCPKKADASSAVKLLWWGSQTRHEKTLKVVEMFQQKFPEITIEPTYTSWGGYWEKLATLAAGNDMPDIVQMTIQNMPQYQQKGLLADVDQISTVDKTAIDKSSIEIGKIDGKLYGVSLGANAYCLAYNKSLFDKAGIAPPNETWTWDDIEKSSLILKEKLDAWGIGNMSEVALEFYVRSKGEKLYADDLKTPGFSAETALEYMQLIDRLHKSGAMEPRKIANETASNEENSTYAKERCAMRFLWSNKVVGISKTLGKDSDLAVFPGPGAEKAIYVKPSMFFCIAKSSKRKEAAGQFINYFVTDIEVNRLLDADRGVPVVPQVRQALSPSLDSQNKKIWDFIAFVADFSTKPMNTNFASSDRECKRALQDVMEQVYYEKMTPEEGAKYVIEDWKSILNK